MNVLGVKERSMMQILDVAVKECEQKNLISRLPSILKVAGYYDLASGNGEFLMVDVQCKFTLNQPVSNELNLSYVLDGSQNTPTVATKLPSDLLTPGPYSGEFRLGLSGDPGVADLDLTFQIESGNIDVTGTIARTKISGKSCITYIPYYTFA